MLKIRWSNYEHWVTDVLTLPAYLEITLLQLAGLFVILMFAGSFAKVFESFICRVSVRHSECSMSLSGIYALGPIVRYLIWIGDKGVTIPAKVNALSLWEIETWLGRAGIGIPVTQRDLYMRTGVRLQMQLSRAFAQERP